MISTLRAAIPPSLVNPLYEQMGFYSHCNMKSLNYQFSFLRYLQTRSLIGVPFSDFPFSCKILHADENVWEQLKCTCVHRWVGTSFAPWKPEQQKWKKKKDRFVLSIESVTGVHGFTNSAIWTCEFLSLMKLKTDSLSSSDLSNFISQHFWNRFYFCAF